MATILTKKKDTTGAPVAGDLTNSTGGAELAVNTADKRLYTKDSGGNVVEVGTNPGAAVTFTAGTVSAPAITTTGDTNTGIFFPAADTIAFAEGGAEAMRINSDSQVVTTAGTASLPAITTTGDVNTGIFFPSADTIAFTEGGAEAMRIDSDGDVGIGTSNPISKLHVNGQGRFSGGSAGTAQLVIPAGDILGDVSSAQFEIRNDGNASSEMRVSSRGFITAYTGGSGLNTGTERMRIDSSGNVGIGSSTINSRLTVYAAAGAGNGGMNIVSGSTTVGSKAALVFNPSTSGSLTTGSAIMAQRLSPDGSTLEFYTVAALGDALAERARITSGGYFKASNDGTYTGSASAYHEFRTTANDWILNTRNTASSGDVYGFLVIFNNQTPNNTTSRFFACADSTNDKCIIYSSGTVTNRTGTYNSFSDLKLKQDVVDANSQWDDIKALRIVKYRLKDEVAADPNYPAYIGVIAQEVEQVSPGLIDNCPDFENVTKTREVKKTREVTPAVLDDEGNEVTPAVTETYTETEEYTERVATGTVTKSVKSSIIYMKAVKALQEAMTRIEALEAQNAAFEARLAALEAK